MIRGLFFIGFLTITTPVFADSGWWIIIGSFSAGTPISQDVSLAAARCGLRAFNDLSVKFRGFQPGYNVSVVGPYGSRAEADTILVVARRCIPDSYVQYGH